MMPYSINPTYEGLLIVADGVVAARSGDGAGGGGGENTPPIRKGGTGESIINRECNIVNN